MSSITPPLGPGAVVGPYEVVGHIATGGMGEVYLGRKRGPGGFERTVVLKVMLPHLAQDERFARMFVDEARIASGLTHPNIVQVYDLGTSDGGGLYLAMEHLQGVSAIACLKRCAQDAIWIPQEIAARAVCDAATGLSYAHAATGEDGTALGLVHRDISPENIFMTYAGPTKVLDFGVAKVRDRLVETQAGEFKGKVGYMAPEIIKGEDPDARADLFSLGVVFFELLTNRRLFHAAVPATALHRVLSAPVPNVRTLRPDVEPSLAELVLKLLDRSPRRRPGSAEEVADRLEMWLAGRPGTSKHVSRWLQERFSDAHALSATIAKAVENTGQLNPADLIEARRLNGDALEDTLVRELSDDERASAEEVSTPFRIDVEPAPLPESLLQDGVVEPAESGPQTGDSGPPSESSDRIAPMFTHAGSEPFEADDSWIRDESRSRGFWALLAVMVIGVFGWVGFQRFGQPPSDEVWGGRYVQQQAVHQTAAGAVFAAESRTSKQPYMLVAERATLNTSGALSALEDARQRLRRLEDPGLPSAVDVGVHQSRPFSVYALEDGQTLASLMKNTHLPRRQGLRLVRGIAEVMAVAEEGKLVHGWLSAELVWVTASNQVRILGFRGPRAISAAKTADAIASGLAPELKSGTPAGPSADQYALARLLGSVLRNADQTSAVAAAAVLARATAVEPGKRYRTTSTFVSALERALRRRRRR